MALDVVQFVDSIAASPTVRLNLNNESPWATPGVDFSPPTLKQAWASTLLTDGGRLTAAAYGNRRLRLSLELIASGQDASATALQALWRELNRPSNLLRYQPDGATNPVFFRTIRSADNQVQEYPGGGPSSLRTLEVEIDAEPFALGLRESVNITLNTNPYFETNTSDWTVSGGTIARSTAQAHEGVASLLLTPNGVAAAAEATLASYVPVVAGQAMRVSAWVRCAVARNVQLGVVWSNGTSETGDSSTTLPVAANTWTLLTWGSAPAPVGTTRCRMAVSLQGTPPASHLLYIDEATIGLYMRVSNDPADTSNPLCFDMPAIKGDVETPLYLNVAASDVTTLPGAWTPGLGRRQSAISVRRRGTPSATPVVLQAESMSQSVDTAVQASSAASGGSFSRVSFTTAPGNSERVFVTAFPATASADVRGTYRVFLRARKNASVDVMQVRMLYTADSASVLGDVVTVGSATTWRWLDMGLVQMPLGYDPGTDGPGGAALTVGGMKISVYAARVSGTSSLDLDCLVFVPADDRYCEVKWPEYGSQTNYVVDSAANAVYAVGSSGEVRATLPEMEGLPPMVSPGVSNRVYFVRDVGIDFANGDDIAATVLVTPYYWPRYLTIRPVST